MNRPMSYYIDPKCSTSQVVLLLAGHLGVRGILSSNPSPRVHPNDSGSGNRTRKTIALLLWKTRGVLHCRRDWQRLSRHFGNVPECDLDSDSRAALIAFYLATIACQIKKPNSKRHRCYSANVATSENGLNCCRLEAASNLVDTTRQANITQVLPTSQITVDWLSHALMSS